MIKTLSVGMVFLTAGLAHADAAKYVLNCKGDSPALTATVLSTPAGQMITLHENWTMSVGTLEAGAYELSRECQGSQCPYASDVSNEIDSASMVVETNDAQLGWASALTLTVGVDGTKIGSMKMTCQHDSMREKLLRAYWTAFKDAHTVSDGPTVRPEDMARVALDLETMAQTFTSMEKSQISDKKKEKLSLHRNRPFDIDEVTGSFSNKGEFVMDSSQGKGGDTRIAVGCKFLATKSGGKMSEDIYRCIFPRLVINEVKPVKGGSYSLKLPLFRLSTPSSDRVAPCAWMNGSKGSPMRGVKTPAFTRTRVGPSSSGGKGK